MPTDTLQITRSLRDNDFNQQQAEVVAKNIARAVKEKAIIKTDKTAKLVKTLSELCGDTSELFSDIRKFYARLSILIPLTLINTGGIIIIARKVFS